MKAKISINQKHPAILKIEAEKLGVSQDDLLNEFKYLLADSYRFNGVKPFDISYDPTNGFMVSASSTIGWLSARSFDLEILPKIPGLTIGKCLAMAQAVGETATKFQNTSKIRGLISNKTEYSITDYIGYSLLDSLYTIMKNGFARKFEEVIRASNDKGGGIQIQEWVARGLVRPPTKIQSEPTLDILPNKIMKLAIQKCLNDSKSAHLKSAFRLFGDLLTEVNIENVRAIDLNTVYLHRFSLPRPDYQRALYLSLAIIRGCETELGGNNTMPSVIFDLDILFEKYVSFSLKEMLDSKYYDVKIQSKFKHNSEPDYPGYIYPDLYIENKNSKKGIILDLKNKYSELGDGRELIPSNPDLYQTFYYSRILNTENAFLIYPNVKIKNAFPIKSSESAANYKAKKAKFMEGFRKSSYKFSYKNSSHFNLSRTYIDLHGTVDDTLKSIASLALLITEVLNHAKT